MELQCDTLQGEKTGINTDSPALTRKSSRPWQDW